jgi:hypothetical protein
MTHHRDFNRPIPLKANLRTQCPLLAQSGQSELHTAHVRY